MMSSEERKFEQVLDALAVKEKRAQKRATLLTALTLGVGLLLMAILSYQIVRLNRLKGGLQQEIGTFKQDIATLQRTKEDLETEIEMKRAQAVNVLTEMQADLQKKDVPAALKKASEGLRTFESPRDVKGTVETDKRKINPQGVENDAKTPIDPYQPGFRNDFEYAGHNNTKITVTVRPQTSSRPGTLFTWALDGKNYFAPPPNNKIIFTLDKGKRNPSVLVLFLNFKKDNPGGFSVVVEASDGNRREIQVVPLVGGGEKQRIFKFVIL